MRELAEIVTSAEFALSQGELVHAFDISQAAIEAGHSTDKLVYLKALALARMSDPEGALASLQSIDWIASGDEDVLALRGRIFKDLAVNASGVERNELFKKASEAYDLAHCKAGGYFSLINSATTAWLAGDEKLARDRAEALLRDPDIVASKSFYAAASAGEALLLLGRSEDAAERFQVALGLAGADLGSRASATRQLTMIQGRLTHSAAVEIGLSLRPPPVIFYAGHMFRHDSAREKELSAAIDAVLEARATMVVFGSAAAGADILFAEAVLERGAELNLVLPFGEREFIENSILPFGKNWEDRFGYVLARASRVTFASNGPFVGDPLQFVYGNEVGMGLACLRADHLCTEALCLAIVGSSLDSLKGGVKNTIQTWEKSGRESIIIAPGEIDRSRSVNTNHEVSFDREVRALVFTDYSGFSKLAEPSVPIFVTQVLGAMADALEEIGDAVLQQNTWGDALFAVVSDAVTAAELAIAIQGQMAEVDPSAMGLPANAGMRVAIHAGPLYRTTDPVTTRTGYFGTEVTRAARIEPITPVGQVYGTQAFAALLALHGQRRFNAHYVGSVPLAKGFGPMPMYRITRRAFGDGEEA